MVIIPGGLENVRDFSFSSVKCGIRYENKLDYTLILSDKECNASGAFTTNKISAACVKICRERIDKKIRGILINSTNANACTGDEGYNNVIKLTGDLAEKLNIPGEQILMASTGIIGRQLPAEKMLGSHPDLLKNLSRSEGHSVALSIMTTDTIPKEAAARFTWGGVDYTVAGIAKGSGMISPNMATLLAFVITDAPVNKPDLDRIFKKTVDRSLNSITIDGDMSTNDTAIIMSPDTGQYLAGESLEEFSNALEYVMSRLSELLIHDGEGATKSVKINVRGALNDHEAGLISRSVAESLLVKTALFGTDPNWGRIACAAGYSGAELDEQRLSIYIEEMPLLLNGKPSDQDLSKIIEIMNRRNYEISIDAGLGEGRASILTTDISYDYIKINAQYST